MEDRILKPERQLLEKEISKKTLSRESGIIWNLMTVRTSRWSLDFRMLVREMAEGMG